MKNNFGINLDNKSTAMTIIIVIGLVLAALAVGASWIMYYWYVVAYAFNHVVSPIFNVPQISIWVAGGLSTLVSIFFSDMRMRINTLTDKANWRILASPFINHFMLWLLVG